MKKGLLAFLIFAVLALTCARASAQWEPDKSLVRHSADDEYPSVVYQNTTGNIWIVWSSNRTGNHDIFCKTSSDGGASWSEDKQLTNNPNCDKYPSIMQATDGSIWVVWAREIMEPTYQWDLYYKTSSDDGFNWSEDKQLTNDTENDLSPSITHADGKIWVFFQSDRIKVYDPIEEELTPQDDIYYKTSTDGVTWSDDKRLTTKMIIVNWTEMESIIVEDINPSVTQTSDGKIWIVWVSNRYADRHLFYKTSSNGGATWSNETQLTTYASDNWVPSIIQTSDERIWVVFHSLRDENWDIFYKVTSDGGAHWSNDIRLTTDPKIDVVPSITQTADGKIWIVWMSNRVFADLDGDGYVDWSDFVLFCGSYLSKVGDPAYNTAADLDSDGDVDGDDFILFCGNYRSRGGSYDIWYKSSILLLGDIDGDHDVDWSDFVLFCGSYLSKVGDPAYNTAADLDSDGDVDGDDFILFCGNYGKSVL